VGEDAAVKWEEIILDQNRLAIALAENLGMPPDLNAVDALLTHATYDDVMGAAVSLATRLHRVLAEWHQEGGPEPGEYLARERWK
jgi:hypothetical protein